MRLFQVIGTLPAYSKRARRLMSEGASFAERIEFFLDDAFCGVHTLLPNLNRQSDSFFTHHNEAELQRTWATEKGLSPKTSLDDILLAQIEEHKPDVFYTLSTILVGSDLARRMPGCVKAKIGWHAQTSSTHDMSAYLIVSNFPTLNAQYESRGIKTCYFAPAHDPALDRFAANEARDIDVVFIGTYSQYHTRRAPILEAVASLQGRHKVAFALQPSRLNRLAETPLGWFGPLRRYAMPADIRRIAQSPVYGIESYELVSRAKIVLNGAGDIGGNDRGNMRCWEALGARALMVSDQGDYPVGMVDGETMLTYRSRDDVAPIIEAALADPARRNRIANAGYAMLRDRYSKARQWQDFKALVANNFT